LITADEPLTAMIMLARFACLRLTELTTLRTDHREGDLLRITGKGEKQRLVPINDDLMHALLTLERMQGEGFYFPGRWGGSMHPQSVNKIITRHLGTNPHSLRHAGATAAYIANPDLEALRLFLGHSSVATTQRYLHVGMDAVRRVAASTAFVYPVASPHFERYANVA
jgi:integrase